MLAYNELATLYGIPHGAYVAVHPVADHRGAGFGFAFEAGRTGVIDGKACARIFHGIPGVSFEPADDDTRRAVVEHVRNYVNAARADELAALFFPAPTAEPEPEAFALTDTPDLVVKKGKAK